jgi:mRNA interferase HigB
MHIIKVKTLRDFWTEHPDVEQPLRTWVSVAEKATWRNQEDVKASYPGVTPIKDNRFVFKRLKGSAPGKPGISCGVQVPTG